MASNNPRSPTYFFLSLRHFRQTCWRCFNRPTHPFRSYCSAGRLAFVATGRYAQDHQVGFPI